MQLATCQNLTDTPRGSYIFGMPNDLHRAILTAVIELDVSHEKSYAPPPLFIISIDLLVLRLETQTIHLRRAFRHKLCYDIRSGCRVKEREGEKAK